MSANYHCKGSIVAHVATTLALVALTAAAIVGAARLSGAGSGGERKAGIADSIVRAALGADQAAVAADWYRPRRPSNQIAAAQPR